MVSASLSQEAWSTTSQSKSTSTPSTETTSSVVAVATAQRPSINSAAASAVMRLFDPGASGRASLIHGGTSVARRLAIPQRYDVSYALGSESKHGEGGWIFHRN